MSPKAWHKIPEKLTPPPTDGYENDISSCCILCSCYLDCWFRCEQYIYFLFGLKHFKTLKHESSRWSRLCWSSSGWPYAGHGGPGHHGCHTCHRITGHGHVGSYTCSKYPFGPFPSVSVTSAEKNAKINMDTIWFK